MDQPGNNHLLLRASQSAPPAVNGQHAAADRMRELLARTVQDHIVEERSVASALQEIRLRLDAMDGTSVTAIAATIDGLAATLGTLDSKLIARIERLDERLDDQYDRVRSIDGKLDAQSAAWRRRWPRPSRPPPPTSSRASRPLRTRCSRWPRRCSARPSAPRSCPTPHITAGTKQIKIRITRTEAAACGRARRYSHSMVPGGLLVMSRTTRLTSRTSLVIRVEIRSSTS